MSATGHSPLPWRARNLADCVFIEAADFIGRHIATVPLSDNEIEAPDPATIITRIVPRGRAPADVELILRACNAHYRLRAELGRLVSIVEGIDGSSGNADEALAPARALIAELGAREDDEIGARDE